MSELEFNQNLGQVGIEFAFFFCVCACVWFKFWATLFPLRPPEHLSAQISKVATNLTHKSTQMSATGISFHKQKTKMAAPQYVSCDYTTGSFVQTRWDVLWAVRGTLNTASLVSLPWESFV